MHQNDVLRNLQVIKDLHQAVTTNKVARGAMREQIVKFAGCFIQTKLWLVKADKKNSPEYAIAFGHQMEHAFYRQYIPMIRLCYTYII